GRRRSGPCTRSTRATNESTNACVPSARRSTASTVKTQSVRPGQPRPGLSIAVRCPTMAATGQGRASARINIAGRGETNVATGVPVLDHLLTVLAVYASFDLALEVEPGSPEIEFTVAARSLG